MERGSNLNMNQPEDNGEDLDFLLPPKQVIGPDENGIKKVIEYKFNEDKDKVKITTTTRIRKLASTRLSKRAVERRSWSKFGDAVDDEVGSRRTMVSTEEIILERRPRPPGTKAEEDPKVAGDSLAQRNKGAVLMVCRARGKKGDHWTARRPYKDLAPESVTSETTTFASGPSKGAFLAPSKRAGAKRTGTAKRYPNNCVRVTNLSEDTREADLHELFEPFGAISRVNVVVDQKTGMSKGLGFVNFVNREEGQRAIDKLNGYGYDNLILSVTWASTNRPN